MKIVILKAALISLILPSLAFALRPLATDDASIVEEGHLEVEVSFAYVHKGDEEYSGSTSLKYGLGERLDLGVEIPYQYLKVADDNVGGISDITLTSKFRLVDAVESLPAISFVFSFKTDTGDEHKGLGSGEKDYGVTAVLTRAFRKSIVHLNLGYTYVGVPEGSHEDVFSYALAGEYPLNERLNLAGELTGENNFKGKFDDNPFAGLVGVNCAFSETVTFDLGVAWGISEASSDYTVTTGLTLCF